MRSRLSSLVVFTALALTGIPVAVVAQGTSVLRGRVTDPQSAVVSGAAVTVTIEATGAKRKTTSDDEGGFVVAELPPGLISVEVVANGFASQLFEHLAVGAGQTRDLEVALAVAGVREVITIAEADAYGRIDTVTSSVDTVIGQREIATLPLNGRNFLELAFLVPGNAPAPNFDPTKTNSVSGLVGRPARSRRQRHDRRRRQQRRRGRRPAAERAPGRRAGVPDWRPTGSPRSTAAPRRR